VPKALRYGLTGVDRVYPTRGTVVDGRSVVVEVAHDAMREAVQLSFGWVLDPD
jgi:hypothetical protein